MSGGILRFPWTSQPQSPVGIDQKWLDRGLAFAAIPGQAEYFSQKLPVQSGSSYLKVNPAGRAFSSPDTQIPGAYTYTVNIPSSFDNTVIVIVRSPVAQAASVAVPTLHFNSAEPVIFSTTGSQTVYSTTGNASTTITTLTAGNVNALAGVKRVNSQEQYVNGALATTNVTGNRAIGAITTVSVGRPSGGNNTDEVEYAGIFYFTKALSAGEIAELTRHYSKVWQVYQPVQRTIWVPNAGGGGVSGTLATTNANDTSAATGTTTVTGTLATTNANDSSSASGTTTVTGTLATTNANDTSAASGSPVVVGTLATTNANDSVVASGDVGGNITGTVNYTNANDTGAASGTTTVTGSLATTNANDSASASGTTTVTGTSAYTNANDTVAASGAAGTVTGTVNVTNDNDTSAASGTAGNPVIASQGGGGWLPQTRRKSRKQIYEERVKLGILPPPVIKAAAKVAAVAQTVEEFKEERPRYEEMFLKAIKKTEWLPDYTRAIQAAIMELEQEEEELLMLL